MSESSKPYNEVVDAVLSTSEKLLENAEQFSQTGLTALKKVVDNQCDLGAALADFGKSQYDSFSEIGELTTFLQRQKDAGETFGGKVQAYFESLRDIARDTQQAYAEAGKKFVADLKVASV